MRRVLALVLACVSCLSLCACGKSEKVMLVEEAISQIGEVDAYSGEAIAYAQGLYDELTMNEKEKVSNRDVLMEASSVYEAGRADLDTRAKEAYDLINEACDGCKLVVDEILSVRAVCLYQDLGWVEITRSTVFEVFAEYLDSFSAEELQEAAKTQALAARVIVTDFLLMQDVIEYAIEVRGDYDVIAQKMAAAEEILQEMGQGYGDTTYYPMLQEYFDYVRMGFDFVRDGRYGKFNYRNYPRGPEEPVRRGGEEITGWGIYYENVDEYRILIGLLLDN